jgi:Xaa-Pro aminopeptidase
MTAAIRPGAPASAPADAALQTIAQSGIPLSTQHSALSASYGLGHGIGLDLEEAPWLRPGETTPLPEGAVLALHVVLHGEAGRGALATGMVVVGPEGAESLLAPESLLSVGG